MNARLGTYILQIYWICKVKLLIKDAIDLPKFHQPAAHAAPHVNANQSKIIINLFCVTSCYSVFGSCARGAYDNN